jgi:hypothetical protein
VKKDQFGFALAINSKRLNRIAVAARRADTEIDKDTGSVYSYAFNRSTGLWELVQILLPDDLTRDDEFGQSLAMDPIHGAWLSVGADQSGLAGPENAGALYIFSKQAGQP